MPSTTTDRLNGLTTSVAVKPACRAGTTAAITLSGLQTIDGVVLASGDRVLVKDQADTIDNGVWIVSSGAWSRAADFNGSLDVVVGTLIEVHGGTVNAPAGVPSLWSCDSVGVIGRDATLFRLLPIGGGIVPVETTFTATEGQVAFALPVTPSGVVALYANGVRLVPTDFTVSGKIVTVGASRSAGDSVVAVAQSTSEAIRLSQNVVNVLDYMSGAALTSDLTAEMAQLQAAVTASAATGQPLYIPQSSVVLRVNGTATVPAGGISIIGGGVIHSTADLPVFKLVGGAFKKSYEFEAIFELGSAPTAACAIELASATGTDYIQYSNFDNVIATGAIAAIVSSSATRVTANGLESSVNWNKFSGCKNFDTGTGDARNVVWFKTGSGTGNTFIGMRGNLGATGSAYARFDGVGCVVGDIEFSQGHLCAVAGGSVDCAAIEVGPSTVYRSNIGVFDSQSDANVARVFRLSITGAAAYSNIRHDGSLIGGATVLGIDVPVSTMHVSDRDGGFWEGGQAWSTNAVGAESIAVCKVTLSANKGVRLTLNVDGTVGGVSSGTTKFDISLKSDGTTVTATTVSTSADPSGLFAVAYSVSGLAVTISVTFTSTSTGSNGSANWNAVGNSFFVQRLP